MPTITQLPPVESPQARRAIVTAYRALSMLDQGGLLDFIAKEAYDPQAAEQARAALDTLERSMSPNLLVTVLPAYTKVRWAAEPGNPDEWIEGLIRDGAWGLYPDERGETATERRITTTGIHGGWEFFVNLDTVFTAFEIVERAA